MTKMSRQFLISGQFQDNFKISGISGQLGALQNYSRFKYYCPKSHPCDAVGGFVRLAGLASTKCIKLKHNDLEICLSKTRLLFILYGYN